MVPKTGEQIPEGNAIKYAQGSIQVYCNVCMTNASELIEDVTGNARYSCSFDRRIYATFVAY